MGQFSIIASHYSAILYSCMLIDIAKYCMNSFQALTASSMVLILHER